MYNYNNPYEWNSNPRNPRFRQPNFNPRNYPPYFNPHYWDPYLNPRFPPRAEFPRANYFWRPPLNRWRIPQPPPLPEWGFNRPPKAPRYNNNNNYHEQANVQQLPTSQKRISPSTNSQPELTSQLKSQTAVITPVEKTLKVPDRQKEPEVLTTQPEVEVITIPSPQPTFNPTVEADKFMAILKRLISPDGLKLVDTLWISEIKELVTIVKNAADDQTFYEDIRDKFRTMDRFKMLQVWAAMFLIDPEVCLKHKSPKYNMLLRLCSAHFQSIISTVTSQRIAEFLTAQAYLKALIPVNMIPPNNNLEKPFAQRLIKDLQRFTSLDFDSETNKPSISTIRREAGFFKSNLTNGIEILLGTVAILLWTTENDIDSEMQSYSKIESIVRDFSETSSSRFEFVDCLLDENFDLQNNDLGKILILKRKLWAVCTILNCSSLLDTNCQNSDDFPSSILTSLNSIFRAIFYSCISRSNEFYEFVAIRQHLGLSRSHQMSEIDTLMDKTWGREYCWNRCVVSKPMKSRIDFADAPIVLPEISKPKNLMDLTFDVILPPTPTPVKKQENPPKKQSQPVSKPKYLIDLTSDDKEVLSKRNDATAVVKVNEFMEILDSIIKPYAASREDKLWKDKIGVFRSIIIYPKNESSFIDDLRHCCRHSKLDPIAMLRIWIELFLTDSNNPVATQDVMLKILSRAYIKAVDETGRQLLGELLTIRKHLMGSLPSEVLSKGDINLMSKPYVQRLIADNPDLIFKSTNLTAAKILKAINPCNKTPPVSTLPITELLKQVTKTTIAEGIDKLLDEAELLLNTKEKDVVSQMKSFAKIVRIMNGHSSSEDSDFEFIDCLLTEPFLKSKGTLHGRLLLWAVCALLNYAHIPNKKHDLPDPTVLYLSRQFKNSLVEKQDRLEFVAIRQHLGRGRSHQMSKIDKYADEICTSEFNWRNRVEKSRRLSREDFVTPENFMCHPKLAYTFYVNNNDSRKTSNQLESNNDESEVNDKAYDSDCESETGSVEILSDVEKPPAPIVDLFSSDEEEDEVISKPIDSKPDELEMTLELKTASATKINQVNEQRQDNLRDNHSAREQQTSNAVSHKSFDLNQVNQQAQNNTSDDFSNTTEQKTTAIVPHESTCEITCTSAGLSLSKTERDIECTCSVEFIKANRPSCVFDNKPEDKLVEKVSPVLDELTETRRNDLPSIIGIPCEVLNAEEFVNYIWDNNLVKLVEEPVALEIEKEVANLLTLPFVSDISFQEQQDNQKTE